MATTIDIPCPKCKQVVCCDYFKGFLYDLAFFRFGLTSFKLECSCGFKKTFRFVGAKQLQLMYEAADAAKNEERNETLPYVLGSRDVLQEHVAFRDDNDHNPLIEVDCPVCSGTGSEIGASNATCSICLGRGRKQIRYFDNNNPIIEAPVNQKGSCKCPNCGFLFAISDRRRWSGLRHARCGQRIKLKYETKR